MSVGKSNFLGLGWNIMCNINGIIVIWPKMNEKDFFGNFLEH